MFNLNSPGSKMFAPDPIKGQIERATRQSASFQKTLNVALSDVITLSGTGPATQSPLFVSITHSLGYIPAFIAYVEDQGERTALPYTLFKSDTATVRLQVYATATADKLTFYARYWDSASLSLPIRYYIFREPSA